MIYRRPQGSIVLAVIDSADAHLFGGGDRIEKDDRAIRDAALRRVLPDNVVAPHKSHRRHRLAPVRGARWFALPCKRAGQECRPGRLTAQKRTPGRSAKIGSGHEFSANGSFEIPTSSAGNRSSRGRESPCGRCSRVWPRAQRPLTSSPISQRCPKRTCGPPSRLPRRRLRKIFPWRRLPLSVEDQAR